MSKKEETDCVLQSLGGSRVAHLQHIDSRDCKHVNIKVLTQ